MDKSYDALPLTPGTTADIKIAGRLARVRLHGFTPSSMNGGALIMALTHLVSSIETSERHTNLTRVHVRARGQYSAESRLFSCIEHDIHAFRPQVVVEEHLVREPFDEGLELDLIFDELLTRAVVEPMSAPLTQGTSS